MIDITTLDFTPALSEGDHYSMANAVAEVELDNGRSAEIYIAADYEEVHSTVEPCHLSIARRRLQGGVRLLHH